MRTRVVVGMLFVGLTVAISFAPRCQAKQTSTYIENEIKNQSGPFFAVFFEHDKSSNDDESRYNHSPDRDTTAQWIPIVIALITLVFIGWQAWETRKSADAARDNVGATKDNASAALKNANALINIERAWLLPRDRPIRPNELPTIRITPYYAAPIKVKFRNFGHTPAWLLDWSVNAVILENTNIGELISAEEPEGDFPNARPVPPNQAESFTTELKLSPSDIDDIRVGTKHVYIYGFAYYRGNLTKEQSTSRFCFHYFRRRNTVGLIEEGWATEPPQHNHYT